jgi:group I intron endonuclease
MIIDDTCPEKNYFIYKITNNINGKVYIGRTTQTIQKRWFVHQCHAKYDYTKNKKTVEKTYLASAMKKYGVSNFTIKELDVAESFNHMVFLERFYINYFNSIDPKYGYNLVIDSYGCGSDEPINTRTKNKIALSSKIKAEKPEGVCWDNTRKKWVLSFKYLDKITIRKRYNNQQECEYHRDILFYYYTKNENPLNYYYPDNIEYYKKYNVLELLDSILPTKPNNTYRGVYKDNKCGKFIVRLVEHGGVDVYLGIYDSEDEAVLIHDKVVAFRGNLNFLNLPHLRTESYEREGQEIFEKYTNKSRKRVRKGKQSSQYKGVSKRTTHTWEMLLTVNKKRIREVHETELNAAISYDSHIRRLNLGKHRLNFPTENDD